MWFSTPDAIEKSFIYVCVQVGLLDYVTQHYKPTEEMQTSSQRSGISAKFKYLFCRCPCFASRNNPHNEDINPDVDDNVSYVSNDYSVDNEDLTIFLENGERPEGKYFYLLYVNTLRSSRL